MSNKSEIHVYKDIRTQVKFDAVYYVLESSALFRQKSKFLKPVDEKHFLSKFSGVYLFRQDGRLEFCLYSKKSNMNSHKFAR